VSAANSAKATRELAAAEQCESECEGGQAEWSGVSRMIDVGDWMRYVNQRRILLITVVIYRTRRANNQQNNELDAATQRKCHDTVAPGADNHHTGTIWSVTVCSCFCFSFLVVIFFLFLATCARLS